MAEHKSASPSESGDQNRQPAKTSLTSETGARTSVMGDDFVSSAPQSEAAKHPAWSLEQRKQGFGIGGGYERPYRARATGRTDCRTGLYGPIPHAGYYGANDPARRFSLGQATYRDEISWYRRQFGEKTSGSEDSR
jgi:hypothetical protein